jgi:hypothetical protein
MNWYKLAQNKSFIDSWLKLRKWIENILYYPNDYDNCPEDLKYTPEIQEARKIGWIKKIKRNPIHYEDCPEDLKHLPEILEIRKLEWIKFIKHNPNNYDNCPEDLKHLPEIIEVAKTSWINNIISDHDYYYKDCPKELKNTPEIQEAHKIAWINEIKYNPNKYDDCPKEFKHLPEILEARKIGWINLLKDKSHYYKDCPEDLKHLPEIIEALNFKKTSNNLNWYKLSQEKENLSQWDLKQKIKPLESIYQEFLTKQHNDELSPQDIQNMETVKNELNHLGQLLQQDILNKKQPSKELISQGKEHEVSPTNFLQYHYTGFIPQHVYETYKTKQGISFIGTYEEYPLLVKSKNYNGEIIEFRKKDRKLQYVKTDANDDIVRDEQGLAIMMSDEEMQQKNLPLTDTTMTAFNSNKEPIGFASNEFGADGIWVVEEYQKKGIGADLLYEFRKQFRHGRKIGQMTNQGISLTKSYHKKLIQDALNQGKYVPEDILKEYGLK